MAKYLELTREVMNAIRRRREAERVFGDLGKDRKTPSPTTPEPGHSSVWEWESEEEEGP